MKRTFKPLQMPSDMTKDPRKEFLDPRDHVGGAYKIEVRCSNCKVLNHNKFNCYYCGYQLSDKVNITINYKAGGRVMSRRQYHHMIEETTGKNAKDYLQPMRYNKYTKQMEKNPEYIKVYGDPFKKNAKQQTTKGKKDK